MNICFPKSSDNGALGTGTGLYDDGSAKGQKLTITHAWIADDTLVTLWLKVKTGKKTNLCSVMCELDEDYACFGYFSCQPSDVGTVSLSFSLTEVHDRSSD